MYNKEVSAICAKEILDYYDNDTNVNPEAISERVATKNPKINRSIISIESKRLCGWFDMPAEMAVAQMKREC